MKIRKKAKYYNCSKDVKIIILQFTYVYLSLKISMSVLARQAHASEGSSASIHLVPTHARGTLLTVVEDTTSMKRAHAVLVWLKKHEACYQYRWRTNRNLMLCVYLSFQTSMSVRALKMLVQVMVVSTRWAPTAVSVSLATTSTVSLGFVKVSISPSFQ